MARSTTHDPDRSARFDARLTEREKRLLEEAAEAAGYRSLSAFVLQTALDRARAVLAERERILASDADRERFFHALEHPQPPAPALVEAWRSLRAQTGSA